MATAATKDRKLLSLGLSPEKANEILGVALMAVVVLLAGSLLSFDPLDPSVLHHVGDAGRPTHNLIGPFGAQLASLLFAVFGLPCLLIPVLLGAAAWRRIKGRTSESEHRIGRQLGIAGLLVGTPALLQLLAGALVWRGERLDAGGLLGVLLDRQLEDWLSTGGAFVVLLALLLVSSSLALHSTLGEILRTWRQFGFALWDRVQLLWARRRKHRQESALQQRVMARHLERTASRPAVTTPTAAAPAPEPRLDLPLRVTPRTGEVGYTVRRVQVPSTATAGAPAAREIGPAASGPAPRPLPRTPAPRKPEQEALDFGTQAPLVPELPPVNLLRTDREKSAVDEAELMRRGEAISAAAAEFGVEGEVVAISPGPVITVYEFQPAPGVKVSRIVALQDDLALTLRAESVRIDRIPGRSTLGIEVPNAQRSVIHLGMLLAEDTFQRSPSPLTVALGVDIHGRPHYADLATMPHLLVAGATGAGKSVGLQSMITSILYKSTRDEVQFIFIDPKRIELGVYSDIPHLKTEVVVDPKKAANALRWSVAEMERRYRLLAEVHVRSIEYYNRAIRDPKARQRLALNESETSELRAEDLKPLPYYVIVIDELADLMMVASSDVETSIARLAQMARAVGIHLIVATQRPSVDVLTGTIKANFPCRLSYATATRHDSRTILDQIGSEKLLGKGDALFMPAGTSRIQRIHGAYISEQETAALIRWLKRRGKPDLDPEVVRDKKEKAGEGGGGADSDDELYDEAARLVVKERLASASYLQRRLRIGFSRAARLIDMMEADGLLGPSQGSKSREVLVKPDYFDEIDRARAAEG